MSEDDEFVFTWRIDNFLMIPLRKETGVICSSQFRVKRFYNTEWRLWFKPYITNTRCAFYLQQRNDFHPKVIELEYKVTVNECPSPFRKFNFSCRRENRSLLEIGNYPKKNDSYFEDHLNYCGENVIYCDFPAGNIFEEKVLVVVCHMRLCGVILEEGIFNVRDWILSPSFWNPEILDSEIGQELVLSHEEEIRRLQNLFYPRKYFLRTLILAEKRTVTYPIEDIVALKRNKIYLPVWSCSNIPNLLIIFRKTFDDKALEMKLIFVEKLKSAYSLVCEIQVIGPSGAFDRSRESYYLDESNGDEFLTVGSNLNWTRIKEDVDSYLKFEISIAHDCTTILQVTESEKSSGTVHMTPFPKEIHHLYKRRQFCDLKVGNYNMKFQTHKTVMSAMSKQIALNFQSPLQGFPGQYYIDLAFGTLKNMIDFMYHGKLEDVDHEEVLELYKCAHQHKIPLLKMTCRSILQKNLSFGNETSIPHLADAFQDTELKNTVEDFVYKNALFLRDPSWHEHERMRIKLETYHNFYYKYF